MVNRWRGHHRIDRLSVGQLEEGFGIPFIGTDFYVDGTLGASGNSGRSWGNAFSTIQAGMDAVAALGATTVSRGRHRIFVAPDGYTEDIITPLNTEAPFGSLIAVNPTSGRSGGAAWIISSTNTNPALTIRARGWLIDGFEFDANSGAGGGCILLDGDTVDSDARFTEIRNSHFAGIQSGSGDFGIEANDPATLLYVHHNIFQGFGGEAITALDFPLLWEIFENTFENCEKYLAPQNTKGFQQCYIHDNRFNNIGPTFVASVVIDTRGGAQNVIGPNNFFAGTYDNAGGLYSVASDLWRGNHSEDSVGTVAGGTSAGQARPTS